MSPAIHPAQPMPADEKPGARPYEMVWANRQPPHVPLVNFDSLERLAGRVRRRAPSRTCSARRSSGCGNRRSHGSSIAAPRPRARSSCARRRRCRSRMPCRRRPSGSTATTGRGRPSRGRRESTITLLLLDKDDATHTLELAQVGWKEWWLVHKVLPRDLLDQKAAALRRPARHRRLQQARPRAFLRGPGLLPGESGPAILRAAAQAGDRPVPRPVARRQHRAGPTALPDPRGDDSARQPDERLSHASWNRRARAGGSPTKTPTRSSSTRRSRARRFWEPVRGQAQRRRHRPGADGGRAEVRRRAQRRSAAPSASRPTTKLKASWRGDGQRRRGRDPVHACACGRRASSWTASARAGWRPSFPTAASTASRTRSCCSCPT